MALIETSYVPSKKLIMLDPASIEVRDHNGVYHSMTASGYGTQTKKGVRSISRATYSIWINNNQARPQATLDAFIEYYSTPASRGSSFTDAKWDGSYLWTVNPVPLAEMVRISEQLDPVLRAIPTIPAGLVGFFEDKIR